MLINELRLRNLQVTTGTGVKTTTNAGNANKSESTDQSSFAQALQTELGKKTDLSFSKHAVRRIESRNIEVLDGDKLERLNKGIQIAAGKGSDETLVLVDSTAFVVSVKNNTVITTMSQEDLKGNIFTNIDSTVII